VMAASLLMLRFRRAGFRAFSKPLRSICYS
jgi:hypothetical protein